MHTLYGTMDQDFWNLDGDPQMKALSRKIFMHCNPCRLIAILLGPRASVGRKRYLGVVYTMDHEVFLCSSEICDWPLNSFWDHFSLHQEKQKI